MNPVPVSAAATAKVTVVAKNVEATVTPVVAARKKSDDNAAPTTPAAAVQSQAPRLIVDVSYTAGPAPVPTGPVSVVQTLQQQAIGVQPQQLAQLHQQQLQQQLQAQQFARALKFQTALVQQPSMVQQYLRQPRSATPTQTPAPQQGPSFQGAMVFVSAPVTAATSAPSPAGSSTACGAPPVLPPYNPLVVYRGYPAIQPHQQVDVIQPLNLGAVADDCCDDSNWLNDPWGDEEAVKKKVESERRLQAIGAGLQRKPKSGRLLEFCKLADSSAAGKAKGKAKPRSKKKKKKTLTKNKKKVSAVTATPVKRRSSEITSSELQTHQTLTAVGKRARALNQRTGLLALVAAAAGTQSVTAH